MSMQKLFMFININMLYDYLFHPFTYFYFLELIIALSFDCFILFFFSVFGLHPEVLRGDSRFCTPGISWGIIEDVEDQTQVSQVRGKQHNPLYHLSSSIFALFPMMLSLIYSWTLQMKD